MDYTHIITAIAAGYFLGSLPFGLLITRLFGQGDIRDIGSGNIGATNVLRTGRKELAVLTLILDAGKAAAATLLIQHYLGEPFGLVAGAAALVGHCFPIWLKFKGGKGVATFFGCLIAAAWPVAVAAAVIWLAIAALFRMSSMAALWAAGTAPLVALYFEHVNVAVMAAVLAIIIYIRHTGNIKRIATGTEPKIGQKSPQAHE